MLLFVIFVLADGIQQFLQVFSLLGRNFFRGFQQAAEFGGELGRFFGEKFGAGDGGKVFSGRKEIVIFCGNKDH